jgi:hypothetical protein
VVPENHEAVAELRASLGNTHFHLGVGEAQIFLGQRLTLGNVFLLELGQQRND